jgi:hypothetical protein
MKVTAIVGSYRKGKVIDTLVDEALKPFIDSGEDVVKIYLTDKNILFCTNCRACTQKKGKEAQKCVLKDDMEGILNRCSESEVLILASPVNFMTTTAITKKFIERLLPYTYWPWGTKTGPRIRSFKRPKKSILISSCSMPGLLARFCTGSLFYLWLISFILGAKVYKTFFIGFSAISVSTEIKPKVLKKLTNTSQKLLNKLKILD